MSKTKEVLFGFDITFSGYLLAEMQQRAGETERDAVERTRFELRESVLYPIANAALPVVQQGEGVVGGWSPEDQQDPVRTSTHIEVEEVGRP